MKPVFVTFIAAAFLASASFAHTGVKNAAVKARMDAMSAIATQMKTLGQMIKGEVPFDGEKARNAVAEIADHAARTPTLFEAQEDDPKSEAKPEIWSNFEDFSQKSETLEKVALKLSDTLTTETDLRTAMKSLGAACKACHQSYRE